MKKKFCLGLLAAALSVGSASAQCVVAGTNFDTNSELCCPTLTSDSEEGGWYNEDLDWDKLCKADMFIGPEYAKQNGIGGVFSSDGSNDMTDIDDIFHLNNLQADGKPAQYGYSTVTAQPKLIHSFCKANEVPNNMYVNIGSAPLCPIVSYTVHGLAPGTTAELSFSLHNLLDPTYFDHLATNVCVGGGKAPQLSDFISKYNYSNTGAINGNKLGFGVVSSDDNVQFNTSYNNALQLTNSRNATTATADYGSSTTVTHKATVPATGSVTFYFYRTSDCFQIPIGIDDIKVTGEVKPVISTTGNPCPEQPLRITSRQSYPEGTKFSWKESVTGQTSTDQSFNFVPDAAETDYSITLEITLPGCVPSKSDVLKVHSGTCCTSDDGAPMAKTNLFFDDFGNFPTDDTYEWTDRMGITHTEKIPTGQVHDAQSLTGSPKIPYVRAYNIEASGAKLKVPALADHPNSEDCQGPATQLYCHGIYAVSKAGGYPKGVPHDNSGTSTGGMLQFDLFDDGTQDEFFEIDIEHICTGKEISFGADFASISEHPGSIEVVLEHDGKILDSQYKYFSDGADGWKNASNSFVINSSDVGGKSEVTITMKVRHYGYMDDGSPINGKTRDYAIDNIIFQVCTPPDVNVESSVSTGKDILDLCTEDVLTLTSVTSEAVKRFYLYSNKQLDPNKKVGYVYQYTFQDPSTESETNPITWNTLHDEEVVESESFDVEVEKYWDNIFSQLEDDPKHEKRIYFRVVVGEYSDLIADQSWKKNSAFSPCRKISISTIPVVAGLNCAACVKAEQPEIIGAEETKVTLGKEMKEVNLCLGEIAHLSTENFVPSDPEEMGVADPTSPHKYIATWHKGSKTAPGVKGIGYTDGDDNTSLNVTYEDADIYYLKVIDFDFPGDDGSSCYMWDSVKVIANPVPEKTLAEVKPFCEGTLAANEAPTLTIDGYKLHWYEDADTTKATKEPSVIDKEAKEYEYFYVLEDSKTGCKGEVNPFAFTVNAIPTKVLEDVKVIEYIKGTGSVDISEKAGLEPTKEEYTLFWSTSAAAGDDGSKTAPKHDITKEDKVGKSYYVYQKNEETGCYGEKSEIVVIVNDSPKPVTKDTVVCKGKTIDDLSSLVKKESADYELLWYASESDAKEDGVTTPSALTAEQAAVPGEYTFYVAQKNTITEAISEKAAVTVTVVGVDMPKVKDIDYCTGDDAAPLNENVTLVADESKFTFQSGLEWFVNKN
ncbi:MAG: hypothetical protein J6Q03_02080, partial [Paludibacteraceae bacterium]|nr:hypothetical protein [Paludibacteraceae bacterium]